MKFRKVLILFFGLVLSGCVLVPAGPSGYHSYLANDGDGGGYYGSSVYIAPPPLYFPLYSRGYYNWGYRPRSFNYNRGWSNRGWGGSHHYQNHGWGRRHYR
ncbi:MAG: hypothetical protein RLZZ230_936 [Candidatus Parcubacteria bacterium]